MRQDPQRILAAHRMDPERRELYVEGHSDRIFLSWLIGDKKNKDARIVESGLVELPDHIPGGEKGRLLAFAREVEGAAAQIRILVDADTDRIMERTAPSNVLLTDKRDLEGYVLRLECVEKVLRLGYLNERLDAREILRRVTALGRELGLMRLMSEVDERDLPFQRTELRGHLTFDGGSISLNSQGYATALLQNADISLKELPEIVSRHQEVTDSYSHLDDEQIVHGKDSIVVLERLLREHGLRSEDTGRLLRCSYERQWVQGHPSLENVYEFLTADSP